jgi:hypothetical protein
MTTWERKQGDLEDTLLVGLCGIADITGATVLGLARLGSGAVVQLAGGTIFNAVATSTLPCAVIVPLGSTGGWLETATPGEWMYETELTWPTGTKLTWPGRGYDTIVVSEDLGP